MMTNQMSGMPHDGGQAQQIRYLEKGLEDAHRDIDLLQREVASINRVNDKAELMQTQIKDSLDEMKKMMTQFIKIVQDQNDKIDDAVEAQNTTISNFINSDNRAASKKDFAVSVIQAVGTILFTLATLWVTNVI